MAETTRRFFPYESPYPNQGEAMDRIAAALGDGDDVLFEGAPGTGKTLSALVPALEHAREEDRTVVITTNVHQQMRQFVEEARAINDEEPLRAVVFKGKSSMCHIGVDYQECQTLRDTTRELVENEADKLELEQRQRELLDASREGDATAAEAREAVMEELEEVEERIGDTAEANVCEHYRNNLLGDNDEFYEWLYEGVRTPEEIYAYAEQRELCGYELLKEGMEAVDLVVCNYHHLLDPNIREQFFRWLDREPERVVTVFDEAHNIESAARDHASRSLTENSLENALPELESEDDSRADAAENVIGAFRDALVESYEESFAFGEREQVGEDWYDVPVSNENARDDLTLAFLQNYEGRGIQTEIELAVQLGEAIDEEYEEAYREGDATSRAESSTLAAARFLATWMEENAELGQHPMVSVRRDDATDELYGRAELYTCIPRRVTKDLFDDVYASVLMSATLRPFDVAADVLGLEDPVTMAYGLAYPAERRRTYSAGTPALFSSDRGDPEVQQRVSALVEDLVEFTPGNTLLYFPSYAEAERYYERVGGQTDGTLFLDGSDVETDPLRERFVESETAALFTSLWGTLAEGVSFDGDDARTVAVIGVPYPHLDDRLEAVQDAYDRVYGNRNRAGWRYAVEIPTIRKTRQAMGRVIRSPDDFGVRVLADKRYTREDMGRYSVRDSFPEEERDELIDMDPTKLKFGMLNFYTDMDAYEGDPPRP
ncbi:MAG: ATP-dependent DNA helicase [Halolamina sp.]|uniref:ATP-dependent DNA helicase n=1 Tax=Halolamina sp. TaxID=1940283 RepID=UPI002FC34BB0